jgi:hypothetical protein
MRLRFTIRDLLWLTLVVAMAVGWWLEHRSCTNGRYMFRNINGHAFEIIDTKTGVKIHREDLDLEDFPVTN